MNFPGKTLLTSLFLLCLALNGAETKPTPAPVAPAPAAVARFLTILGTVEVARVGSESWEAAQLKMELLNGDRVRTGKGSRAVVRLPGDHLLRLTESSSLTIKFEAPATNAPAVPAPAP